MFLWLRAKTVSHEIRDFPGPAKESAFQMQNVTECKKGAFSQMKITLSKRYTPVSRIYLRQLGPHLVRKTLTL